ncbi:MAG: putative lipid II flippase FtsW [Negativicutes bacterium]|nr:putative lipid II flippase FtsW [Negativicutes bacterium]
MKLWLNRWEPLVIITILLSLVGTVNILSASFVRAEQIYGDAWFFLKRHLVYLSLGMAVLAAVIRVPPATWRNRRMLTVATVSIGLLLLLVSFTGVGTVINGSRRWLMVGGVLQFQPSELAKIVVIMLAARYLSDNRRQGGNVSLWSGPLAVAAGYAAMVLKQPDMSTATLIVAVPLLLFLIAGVSRVAWLALLTGGVAGLIGLAGFASYRLARLKAWWDPWADFDKSGYQSAQALIAIGASGLTGAGLGKGYSKFNYLPEAHTDFAFAVLCQEWGIAGAVVVTVLFGLLVFYGVQVAIRADRHGCFLSLGMILLIGCQAAVNMAMVTGLLPVMGIPLPFISYGGTALLVQFFAVAVVVAVGRTNERTA